jgi:hypothetical protein
MSEIFLQNTISDLTISTYSDRVLIVRFQTSITIQDTWRNIKSVNLVPGQMNPTPIGIAVDIFFISRAFPAMKPASPTNISIFHIFRILHVILV